MTDTNPAATTSAPKIDKELVLKAIGVDVLDRLKDISNYFGEIESLFAAQKDTKTAEYFSKQVARVEEMMGWYDPNAKKTAQILKLKAMLAKLEAEANESEGN